MIGMEIKSRKALQPRIVCFFEGNLTTKLLNFLFTWGKITEKINK